MSDSLVSIIIPTYNSERTIGICLKSVSEQTYPNIEVIVVDNHSIDRTREIAENFRAKVIATRAKRSKARNLGAERSHGEMLCFVDADMELDSTVISECVVKVGEGYEGIIIPELSIGKSFWAKCKTLEKSFYLGDDTIEAIRFLKRTVFESASGYTPDLEAGEDWDLNHRIRQLGFRVTRVTSFIKHNEGKLSLSGTFLKKHYYGKALKCYRVNHPNKQSHSLKVLRLTFIRNWRKLERDPIHAVGMFFMKSLEFMAILLGLWAS